MGWGGGTTAAGLECVHAPQSPHRAARAAYVLRREQARPPRLMCCSLGLAFALQLVLPALPHPARWVVFAAISLICLPSARTVPLLQGFLGLAFIVQLMLLLFHLKGPGIEVMVHLILGLQVGSFQHCLWAFFNRFSVFEIRFDWSADSWILCLATQCPARPRRAQHDDRPGGRCRMPRHTVLGRAMAALQQSVACMEHRPPASLAIDLLGSFLYGLHIMLAADTLPAQAQQGRALVGRRTVPTPAGEGYVRLHITNLVPVGARSILLQASSATHSFSPCPPISPHTSPGFTHNPPPTGC